MRVPAGSRGTGDKWARPTLCATLFPRLAVVNGGRVWRRGFGQAIEDPAQAASEETIFEAASLGKPVFAYAVLRLADAGFLDLDRLDLFDATRRAMVTPQVRLNSALH